MISKRSGFYIGGIILAGALGIALLKPVNTTNKLPKDLTILHDEDMEKDEEIEAKHSKERARYEWLLSQDPKTGKVPENIRSKEMAWVKTMPVRKNGLFNTIDIQRSTFGNNNDLSFLFNPNDYFNSQIGNVYRSAGPTQNGGRTRAVAFDMRYNNSTNRTILAGGINGGIFRTTDGGANWIFVHPPAEIRSVSSFAQDPTNPNTWYAGTGEPIGASSGYPSAFIYGNGMFKSTDNGASWTKLISTNVTDPTTFASQWCFVHKIAVHPVTGHIYAAIHRRVVRSTDGGTTWNSVFESTITATGVGGVADLLINKAGSKIFVAMSGRNADRALAGIFTSTTGDVGSYSRIAGGIENAADSVASWRAYDNSLTAGDYAKGWGRMVITLSPSNQNILYALVENTDEATNSKPEADLYKCNMATTPFSWTKLTNSLVAKRNATTEKYLELQGGYNMLVAVHPTNENLVLVGGVNLFRSTDGFATKDNVVFAGGLTSSTYTDADGVSHADMHSFAFDPSDPNRVAIGSDGGIGFIKDLSAPTPDWVIGNGQYQSIQYYHVGIDPTPGSRVFYGGAQDNSTTIRDRSGILGGLLPDSNDHYIVLGGDGCTVGMTKKNASNQQYLFCAAQEGQFYRMKLFDFANNLYTAIKPTIAGKGEFVTYFHLDPDNTDYLYYASDDSLFRTNDAVNVTASNWTLLDGVAPAVSGSIFSMATTKGQYTSNSHLFLGTSGGKIYRIKDPQAAPTGFAPTDITPSGLTGGVVTDIAVNPRNQDTVIAVVSNYNVNSIFWTGNATAISPTWQVIEGNLTVPSVRACEIVAKTNGVEYYVGTSTGLFSTASVSGSGTVWSREVGLAGQPSEMMNTAIVNSLAYRWVDNTLVVGTHGNGMFSAYIGNPVSVVTAVTNPIRNNTNFIKTSFPTLLQNELTYQVGNMYGMKKMSVQLTSMSGAVVYRNEAGYQNGKIPVANLSTGTYVLTITSPDRKYQYTKKFIKN
jgi:hypothetical protein